MNRDKLNIAIVYDFDGTLSPGNMQEGRFIPAVGMTKADFWKLVQHRTAEEQSDPTLAYMQVMLETARNNGVTVTRDDMAAWANNITFFPGVQEWFQRLNNYGNARVAQIHHYVVSSGNTEIIEASRIAHNFTAIFGSRFSYDHTGAATWPAEAINFTTKTQYLFRINKNAIQPHQRDLVNAYLPQDERPFPFENMVYIGDGETDVPCFSLVENQGGLAIAVHAPGRRNEATHYLDQGRVNAITEADYRPNSELDRLLRTFIDHATSRHRFRTATRATHSPKPAPSLNPKPLR